MVSGLRIDAFAQCGEIVELLWLRGLAQDPNGNWTVTAFVREWETKRLSRLQVPLGLVPLLAPGQVYLDGELGHVPAMGQTAQCMIPSLRQFEMATLADVPPSVFTDGRPRTSRQELLLYRTAGLDVFIPPLELVRRLFLLDRTLANALLRQGGLAELCLPVQPDFYDALELNFTATMPVRVLKERFVRKFAWLYVHPTGARAWNSVARLSNTRNGIRLDPPEIKNCQLKFRGLVGDRAVLIHELYELNGLRDPFQTLTYTHPRLVKANGAKALMPEHGGVDPSSGQPRARVEQSYDVRDSASRVSAQPDLHDVQDLGNDFTGRISSIKRRYREVDREVRSKVDLADMPPEGQANGQPETVRHETIQISVSEISVLPKLKPLSFRILEPASPDNLGELEPLITTLRRMQDLVPSTVTIAASLCAVPGESAITWAGHRRRPCLVAVFSHPDRAPVVLIDIDHSGGVSLSAIALHFLRRVSPNELERGVAKALASLDASGHWLPDLEEQGGLAFSVTRVKRLLRRQTRSNEGDYQTKWAALLVDRLRIA